MGLFDRLVFQQREKLLSGDLNKALGAAVAQRAEWVRRFFGSVRAADGGYVPVADPEGFAGASFSVVPSSGMTVQVNPGVGFMRKAGGDETAVAGAVNATDVALRLLELSAAAAIVVDAAPSAGNSRIDIVEVATYRSVTTETRSVWNTLARRFRSDTTNKGLVYDCVGSVGRVLAPTASTSAIGYKVGVPATSGAEVAPTVTSGYQKVAEILVASGTTTVAKNMIGDFRRVLLHGGTAAAGFAMRVWTHDTTATAGLLRAYILPAGVRAAAAYDNTATTVGSAVVRFFVAHAASQKALVTVSHYAASDKDISVTAYQEAYTLGTDYVQFDGSESDYTAVPAGMNFAKSQTGTMVTVYLSRPAAAAFTSAPELFFGVVLGAA